MGAKRIVPTNLAVGNTQMLDAQTIQAGIDDGIKFLRLDAGFNTLKAHRLTWLAGHSGKATEMVERILNAYLPKDRTLEMSRPGSLLKSG